MTHGPLRIGVDIGGTFTDASVVDSTGMRWSAKALTTKGDPSVGVVNCLRLISEQLRIDLGKMLGLATTFVHGSTVGTNALIERRGARTGLLMTRGHEQTITIGRVRQKVTGLSEREKIHVTHLNKASPPIILPEDIRSVPERIDARGDVLVDLDIAAAERAIDDLVQSGVESLAICFLWSFLNRTHEVKVRDLIRARHPNIFVSMSSEIAPRIGEYERCVSTAFNSYIGPIVGDYLTRLESELVELGLKCTMLVMQSNGGLSTVNSMLGRPLMIVDSGPAGGVLGANFHGSVLDYKHILCADVGGTTFDVGLVFDNRVQMDSMPVVDRYAYLIPKIYVKSIGAGGGSIVWVDDGGSLRVGPQSAGSMPGPVAYGRGGLKPTVTDALVALGYLDPEFPLGGTVKIDKAAAERALATTSNQLGMSAIELAAGVLQISSAQMADLARKVTVERGLDPRGFALFAYGGAGPVFAAFIARELGSKIAYVPSDSGVFSAFGMLTSDIVFQEESSTTLRSPLSEPNIDSINQLYNELSERLLRRFAATGFDVDKVTLARNVDMRFGMQVHELDVAVQMGPLDQRTVQGLLNDFVAKYESIYGPNSAYLGAGMEFVTFRVIGTVKMERPVLDAPNAQETASSLIDRRRAYFAPHGLVDTEFHAGGRLKIGQTLQGPCIIQRAGDTVVLPPKTSALIDPCGGIVITLE
jgi:N-methylhydantoinase A/oxoprolinase/acetone carboxylase beta subunit